MQAPRPAAVAIAFALVVSLAAGLAEGASLFDPVLKFRTLRTDHFRIYFHQGGDRLAARLGSIAESTWQTLDRPLGMRPPSLTHVVLADQTDVSNGYATPLPYNTIVIYTVWPPGSEFDVDDWLRLVFTHEFTHIVHLDRSRGYARAIRGIFGRSPLAFPNLFLPTWQIEGLATYAESALTGEGRLHAGEFRAITQEAARQHALEPLDRVNGGLTDWPSGQAAYAYGLGFHQYLADRFGTEKLGALGDATAGRLWYVASPVFRRVFGESLGDLWRDYRQSAIAAAGDPSADADVTRITHDGFVAAAPRFDRPRCAGCPPTILYASRTPDDFPSLARIDMDGGEPATVTRRFLGSTTAPGPDELYFDQVEVRRNVGMYSDLYAWSRTSGRTRQLTSDARLHDPDLSPDGTTLVCTRERLGQRDLVLIRVNAWTTVDVLVSEPDTQFNAPRWSPDGRLVAVERHRLGVDPELVVVDPATHAVRVVARADKTRIVMPSWRPDGRAIVAAVAPDDRVFNLVEFSLDGSITRQLTYASGGAIWPEISRDGKTLIFVGYTIDGYDIFSMPYPGPEQARRAEQAPGAEQARPLQQRSPSVGAELARPPALAQPSVSTRYSPLPTLKPTSWFPVVEGANDQTRIGAETNGRDVLGYHNYAASATWLVSAPAGAITPSAAVPDWFVSYAYDRWRATIVGLASAETSFFAGPATEAGTPSAATRREQLIEGGVVVPFIHTRVSHTALAKMFHAVDDYTLIDREFNRRRTALRAAWETRTARTYGYSISPEEGVIVGGTVELVDRALGSSADATTITVDARAFLPAFGRHHVVAARFAGGRSTGDPVVGRTFVLGGAASDASVIDFGSGAASLLRGFDSNSFAGSHVALANLEYRWPLARPQRGIGTWPIFLHTLHAAAFVDEGHAWTRVFDASAFKTSVGGEMSANIVLGYAFPLTAAGGVAWRRDGSGVVPSGVAAYFRLGKSF